MPVTIGLNSSPHKLPMTALRATTISIIVPQLHFSFAFGARLRARSFFNLSFSIRMVSFDTLSDPRMARSKFAN
jgi:hypothetical protein